jgi:dTDP-glucose 4,6-dehydratase
VAVADAHRDSCEAMRGGASQATRKTRYDHPLIQLCGATSMTSEQSILVTGGAGFIGSALVRYLIGERATRVVTVDRLGYAGSLLNLRDVRDSPLHHFEQVDIIDGAALSEVFERHQPTAVMHLAAESHVDRSIDRPADFIQSNLVGTYQVLDCALHYMETLDASAAARFRVLHVSTDEVYGSLSLDAPAFREGDAYEPNSPYSASKAGADHLATAWAHTFALPVLITNCTNNYGPYQFPEKLIPVVIMKALAGQPIPIYGRGDNVRDWLHVDDHVRALTLILERGRIGERYNIGGECEVSNLQLVKQICTLLDELEPSATGMPYEQLIEFVADRPGHDLRYAMDIKKVRTEFAWQPQHSLTEGLRNTVAWYLANRQWCAQITNNDAGKRQGLR